MTPLPAEHALTAYYLEARSKILDLAATLDRIDRAADAASVAADPRLERLRAGLRLVADGTTDSAGRAESVQRLFSLDYDPGWKIPEPR